jgi:N-acyl-D-amino-acid deacylase
MVDFSYDLVIKDGYVVDGTCRPRFKANVYVEGDRITRVASEGPRSGDRVIDADGMIVSPGFVDMHSHSDFTIFGNRKLDSLIHQGATTLYFTPDGWSPAPVDREHRRELEEYYEPLTFGSPLSLDWTSYDEYFKSLEEGGIGVNIRANVGFGTVRINAMGFEMREPTTLEMDYMKEMVNQAFLEGVCGMSTGVSYTPQCYSTTEEILELCKVVADHGGIYHTHTRGGIRGMKEAIELGERSSIPVNLTHTTPSDEELKIIEEAVARGVEISFDGYPYTAGSTLLSGIYVPGWAKEGGRQEMLKRLRNQDVRKRIGREWGQLYPERWPNVEEKAPLIAWCHNEESKKYEGLTLEQVSFLMDVDHVDTVCNLLIENEGKVMYVGLNIRKHRHVKRAFQHPLFVVGSDSWAMAPYGLMKVGYPHPRCYGTYPKILGRYVRQMGLLALEEAINKMSYAPAQRMLIKDRGALIEGMAADITIFNPDTVMSGIEYVIVNGETVIKEGRHTGRLAGKALRYKSPRLD